MNIKKFWDGLHSERKRKAVFLVSLIGILLVSCIAYLIRSKPATATQSDEKPISVTGDTRLLEKSLYATSVQQNASLNEQMSELKKEIADIEKNKPHPVSPKPSETTKGSPRANRTAPGETPGHPIDSGRNKLPSYPPPPPPGTFYPSIDTGASSLSKAPKPPEAIAIVGDIGEVTATVPAAPVKKKSPGKKIYLPISFMEATLLSGLDAPTVEGADRNPVPVLLRIKDLAVLPNRVKANLKGCFAIATGYGSLADERAHMRVVSISCITRKGQAVIDQKVKGYLVDQDGKIGLKGRVVSRMGSAIARSMIAGFFGGMGSYLTTQNTTTSTNALGSTQTINAANALQYGAANGLAASFNKVQDFYLQLAKQAMPVIEVGATKSITLVIDEGTMLHLRTLNPSEE